MLYKGMLPGNIMQPFSILNVILSVLTAVALLTHNNNNDNNNNIMYLFSVL